jgi:hypothetical protein
MTDDQKSARPRGDLESFLTELSAVPWFQHVGEPIADAAVRRVLSWDEAWERTQDASWSNAAFHSQVDQSHPAWALGYDAALRAIEVAGAGHELEPGVDVSLQGAWDAGGAAYQIAIGNGDGFYTTLMDWYRQGHWPCGWEGTFPKGTLVVY